MMVGYSGPRAEAYGLCSGKAVLKNTFLMFKHEGGKKDFKGYMLDGVHFPTRAESLLMGLEHGVPMAARL